MIHDLKNGKAPGLDRISAELLKNLNEQFHKVFVQFFNRILERGDFPEEWAVGIIFLLFKGGDKRNLDNYRGITFKYLRKAVRWSSITTTKQDCFNIQHTERKSNSLQERLSDIRSYFSRLGL